ncbi:ATP-binding protein [Ammoniphilus sp. YIM 78166]|uniref:ATP-binding protein n=1 Tax=Ammoniphilus sp. YIM 78166 TaxID=1644106 RepID=UPI00106FBADC|nr:ATP-binding protein [Ammoniphilus sp. YIM 78166]
MTNHKWFNHLVLYLFIVVIPSIVITSTYMQFVLERERDRIQQSAQVYASHHAMNIDSFIGETIGRLESMALLISLENADPGRIEELLVGTHGKDDRFSGFYWVSPQGDILLGSNQLPQKINLMDREYFKAALSTKKTTISNAHLGRVTGRYIVSVATPVTKHDQVLGVLIGSVRLDVIQEHLSALKKEEEITVLDGTGQELFLIEKKENDTSIAATVATSRIPWLVTVRLSNLSLEWRFSVLLISIGLSFIITHILFLLIKYYQLQRQIRLEKLQNDAQKMELIGGLAASTAHEIRNPLTGIKGLTKLLSERHQDKQDQFYFSIIQQEIDRINSIVSELLVLGKPTVHESSENNMLDILAEVVPLIESEAHISKVDVVVPTNLSPIFVNCSRDLMKQVILNLTKNALEAMPNGGRLSITLDESYGSCVLVIADTGQGIPEKSLDKIFDPFFTLKKQGTGLGLVVCKRIIEMYKGTISVKSQVDQGTQVTVTLPLDG